MFSCLLQSLDQKWSGLTLYSPGACTVLPDFFKTATDQREKSRCIPRALRDDTGLLGTGACSADSTLLAGDAAMSSDSSTDNDGFRISTATSAASAFCITVTVTASHDRTTTKAQKVKQKKSELAATLSGSRPGVQSASLIMTSFITS